MTQRPRSATRFFILAFGITWGLQLPGVLAQRGLLPGDPHAYLPFVALGIFGPLIAATWLTRSEGGWGAVKQLYAGLLRWRVSPKWYLLALVVPGAALSGLLYLLSFAGWEGPVGYWPVGGAVGVAILISVVEEVGWRGYALARMQERWGEFGAGAFLGVLWYLWHIPMFLGLGVPLDLVFVMLLYSTGASLFLTKIYNASGGSLLLATLAHLGAHLNNSHRALPDELLPLVGHAVVYGGLGLFFMRSSLRLPRRPRTATAAG